MILSRFAVTEGDWADTRFNNDILEHGYRWLGNMAGHQHFSSPPMFFPAANTAAYSDVLLGVAPFYWPWRAIGFAPDSAFQLWMLTIATVNYLAALLLFSRGFKCRPAAAAAGAALFCFAGVHLAQLIHPQLLAQFYIALAILALLRLFDGSPGVRAPSAAHERHDRWIVVLAAACVGQLYSSYYYAWFLFLGMALAAMGAAIVPDTRRTLAVEIRTHTRAILGSAAGAVLAVSPLALHYLAAGRQLGMRTFLVVDSMLPRVQSWLYMGSGSWLYGALAARPFFHALPMEQEQRLGLGVATTVVAALGLWAARRRRAVQFATLVPIAMAMLATRWPGGFSLWHAAFAIVPGASALRAVSRIGFVLVLPASLGIALVIDRVGRVPAHGHKWPRVLASLLIVGVVLLEQGQRMSSFDKQIARERAARVAHGIAPGCAAFLYTTAGGVEDPWRYHVDAIWASMIRGVPTINGYSGNEPPGWTFYDVRIHPNDSTLAPAVARWIAQWKLDPRSVCVLRLPPPPPG